MTAFGSAHYYLCRMIYKEYFINSDFEEVWYTLQTYYNEPAGVRNLYKTLFYTVRNLPADDAHAGTPLKIEFDFENKIHISGTPDPIEWLTGREVVLDEDDMREHYRTDGKMPEVPMMAEFAAHLLYWSTLYDFRTKTRKHKDFEKFLDSCADGTRKYTPENPVISLSFKRKQCYYWKETAANDSAIDWSYILDVLRKRIEYHIGYHRLTERFVNSKHYISRMELSCRLLELAAADYYDMEDVYVNVRNASRYIGPIFNKFNFDNIGKDNDNDYPISALRRAKAYKILWKFLDHNLSYWWD